MTEILHFVIMILFQIYVKADIFNTGMIKAVKLLKVAGAEG